MSINAGSTVKNRDSEGQFDEDTIFVDSVLRCLPQELLLQLIRDVVASSKYSYPQRAGVDWQLRLPFDGLIGEASLISCLIELCYSHVSVAEIRKPRQDQGSVGPSRDIRDRMQVVGEASNSLEGKRGPSPYRDAISWAKGFLVVLMVMGRAVDRADRNSSGFSDAEDVRFLISRGGRRYGLLAFTDERKAMSTIQEHFGDKNDFGVVKKFDVAFRNSKNEVGRSSQ